MLKFCLQLYKQVFYRLYLWNHKVSIYPQNYVRGAIITLSGYTMLNLASMAAITQLITGYRVIEMLAVSSPKLYGVVTAIVIYAAHYLLLSRIGIKNIINEFEGQQPGHSKLNKKLVWGYEIASVLLFFGSFYLVAVRDYF